MLIPSRMQQYRMRRPVMESYDCVVPLAISRYYRGIVVRQCPNATDLLFGFSKPVPACLGVVAREDVHPIVGLAAEVIGLRIKIDPILLVSDPSGGEVVELIAPVVKSNVPQGSDSRGALARIYASGVIRDYTLAGLSIIVKCLQ